METRDVTALLRAWSEGDRSASDALFPLVYAELHWRAAAYLRRERPGHTLQPTALVNEAYLRLADQNRAVWKNRAQFFGVAACIMRRILVDHARAGLMAKRSGRCIRVTLDERVGGMVSPDIDVLALDQALTRLAALDARKSDGGGTALLQWSLAGRDRRGARDLDRDCRARLAGGARVALCRAEVMTPPPDLTPQRWHEITAIFHAAIAQDAATREAFLDEACRRDPSLRPDVDALVVAHFEAGSFGNTPLGLSPHATRLTPGSYLGVFRIDELIGVGGMGEVYRATDTKLGRAVAIKVLPDSVATNPDRLARLEREARVLASLNNPHIAAIYGVEEADGVRALVLELVDGESLAEKLRSRGGRGFSRRRRNASRERSDRHRTSDRRGPGGRAREGHRPSRSQAREHRHHSRQRRGEGAGLRARESVGQRPRGSGAGHTIAG